MNASPFSAPFLSAARNESGGTQTFHSSTSRVSTGFFESAAVYFALFFLSGAFLNEQQGFSADVRKPDPLLFFIQFLAYLCIFPFFISNRKAVLQATKSMYWIWALVALALLSAAWSELPANTAKHSVLLFLTTILAIYFATRFDLDEQLYYLAVLVSLSIVLSFLVAIFLPEYGVMQTEPVGAWRGIYGHRNPLARMMVFAIIIYLARWRARGFHVRYLAGLAAAAFLILKSGSITGSILAIFMCLLFMTSAVFQWSKRKLLLAAMVAVAVVALTIRWVVENWTTVTVDLLGRDPTLSGRFNLWILLGVMGLHRPWLGYGFSAFWNGPAGPSGQVLRAFKWPSPNAHNGFLDLWLDLGLVGLALFLVLSMILLWRSFQLVRRVKAPLALWPLAYVLFFLLGNMDESFLVGHNNLFWFLFVAVAVQVTYVSRMTTPSTIVESERSPRATGSGASASGHPDRIGVGSCRRTL